MLINFLLSILFLYIIIGNIILSFQVFSIIDKEINNLSYLDNKF